MTEAVYIGIDPGKAGAVVLLTGLRETKATRTPMLRGAQYDGPGMVQVLRDYPLRPKYVAIEKVHAMPGQGVTSMFTFGEGFGRWRGIVDALGLPHILVTPQRWQKIICVGFSGDAKSRAQQAVVAQLPWLELCPGRVRKPHQGIVDAGCLALYARWHFGRSDEQNSG